MAPEADRPGPRPGPRPGSRYSLLVGLVFLAVIVIAALNTFDDGGGGGVLGGEGTEIGAPLPEFAVPNLFSDADADANIRQRECEPGAEPCPSGDAETPACEIEDPDAIRVCDLFDRPLVISFWFTTPAECPPTQDAVAAVARRYGDRVNFLSIAVRGEREELRAIAREHGWDLPVGWDRDGAVSSLYRVGGCPTVALALPGGILHRALVGDAAAAQPLTAAVRRLLRASRRAARREAVGREGS